jgi:hypothetical protein
MRQQLRPFWMAVAFPLMKRRLAAAALSALAFLVNPALFSGCRPSVGPSADFGEKEVVAMVHAAAAARKYRFNSDGADYELTVDLAQSAGEDKYSARSGPAVVRVAHACSDRTFLRSAAACLDVTRVPVEGTVSLARLGATGAPLMDHERVSGELMVDGTTLASARSQLLFFSKAKGLSGQLQPSSAGGFELAALQVTTGSASTASLTYLRR